MSSGIKSIAYIALLGIISLSSGCTYMLKERVPPRVKLVKIQLKDAQLLVQNYLVKVRIENPNDFQLDVTGLDFEIEINGKQFASGISNQAFNIPGYGTTTTDISVTTSILVLAQILSSPSSGQNAEQLNYRIHGKVKLSDLPVPVSFETSDSVSRLLSSS